MLLLRAPTPMPLLLLLLLELPRVHETPTQAPVVLYFVGVISRLSFSSSFLFLFFFFIGELAGPGFAYLV